MKKKRFAVAAALGILASMAALPLNASAEADTYTAVKGSTFNFDKYLVMENEAKVPNVTFDFEVAPASGADLTPDENSPFSLYAGPAGIKFKAVATQNVSIIDTDVTKARVTFSSEDDTKTTTELNSGEKTISFMTAVNKEDEKFAEKVLTLDLSDVEFTQPGVYRYIITETAAGAVAGVAPDYDNKRYLDFYVTANTANELSVAGYIFYIDSDNKSTGFTNQYKTDNLMIEKFVTGNQGAKNKHFKINVKLTAPEGMYINDNNVFSVIGSLEKAPEANSATIYSADTMGSADGNNVTELTYAQLKAGHDFYLCSGHNVEIKGIPNGLGYVVTEYQEKYTPSVAYSSGSDNKTGDKDAEGTVIAGVATEVSEKKNNTYSVTDTYLSADTNIKFTNELKGDIPTGVLMSVAGGAGLAAVGAAGVLCGYFFKRKKKSEEE